MANTVFIETRADCGRSRWPGQTFLPQNAQKFREESMCQLSSPTRTPGSLPARRFSNFGGMGIRTPGLVIANDALYQLSYTPAEGRTYHDSCFCQPGL